VPPAEILEKIMTDDAILRGKKILAVDDEPDVLETIEEALSDCDVVTATDFNAAKKQILEGSFDLVLLDIMGVNGFVLLEVCNHRHIPAAMLTANAINVESFNLSMKLGAVSFLPKETLGELPEVVAEIFEGLAMGKPHWSKVFKRLGPHFVTMQYREGEGFSRETDDVVAP
jgi:DNA-binding NtrC family response regulator